MASVLKPVTKDKLLRLLNSRPPVTAERGRGGPRSWLPVLVVANSATAAGVSGVAAQCYDASVVKINSGDDEQNVGLDVWLTVLDGLDDAISPVEGKVYHGLYAGRFDPGGDDRPRVFAAPAGSGGTGPSSGGCGGCGWLLGLDPSWCLYLSVVSAGGACADLDTTQEIELTWSSGTTWNGATDFEYPSDSGPVVFTVDPDGTPHLTIDGIELFLDCCGEGFIEFRGGPLNGLCDGTAGAACAPNTFRVRITCTECDCSIDGWDGPGWYCVEESGVCVPVELLDEDRCDDGIVICGGPYADEATATAACANLGNCCFETTTYAFTLTGVTDNLCHCTGINTNWNLVGGSETKGASTTTSCVVGFPAQTASATMQCEPPGNTGYMVLAFHIPTSGNVAQYRHPLATWNCNGVNVMELSLTDTPCSNWPATLTVTATT